MAEPSAPPAGEETLETAATSSDAMWSDALASAAFTVARRFAAGGTLWVWAPRWPWHAHHVAVEFVHPVVVGSRALDAVAVPDTAGDPTDWLRTAARAGDILLVLSTAADPAVGALLRRAAIWGLTTLWVGTGPAPTPGAADHVLFAGDLSDACYDGSLVLAYHLLWELTQICLEHPGLLSAPPAPPDAIGTDCTGVAASGEAGAPVCVTCSDEGRLAEVVSVRGTEATVRTPEGTERVEVSLVGALSPGSLVLVHAGMAIATVDDPPPEPQPASARAAPA